MANYDGMSFKQAFAAARGDLGSGKTFTWKGKSYKTDTADGKKAAPKATNMTSSPRPMPKPAAAGMTSSPRPMPKPAANAKPAAQPQRPVSRTPGAKPAGEGKNLTYESRAFIARNTKPAATSAAPAGMTSSPRPMPKPAAAGMTSSPRPMPKPAASAKPEAQPQRPVSKTPGAKPAGEGKNLTYGSRAFIARNTKGK